MRPKKQSVTSESKGLSTRGMFNCRLAMMNADEWSNSAVFEGRRNKKGNL